MRQVLGVELAEQVGNALRSVPEAHHDEERVGIDTSDAPTQPEAAASVEGACRGPKVPLRPSSDTGSERMHGGRV
ncbi:hypothetical protein GCM10025877_27180 [Agromyces mangrovi Wang et al. 2018]|nr:hypothetical protein GCM10025877_27180 [Agromyces mangrovi]